MTNSKYAKQAETETITKMSASPQHTSTKRPLDDVSSPSRTGDQPDAKRPALDKVVRNDGEIREKSNGLPAIPPVPIADSNGGSNGSNGSNGSSAAKKETKDGEDASTPDATENKAIASTASSSNTAPSQTAPANAHDETSWIHIRAVISSPEAATIIGKGGENVSKIRQMSNAKCTVSDYQKGAVERILTVSGVVDAVAKVRLSRHRSVCSASPSFSLSLSADSCRPLVSSSAR